MVPVPHDLAIRARGLWKRYGGRDALKGASLEVPRGVCCALFGPNGAGKTTLLRILATLAEPGEGEVTVLGHALPKDAAAVRARVGLALDQPLLPRDLSLGEGLRYYAALYGIDRPAARIEALLARFGLEGRARDAVRTLSRGLAQAAGLVRALLHEPSLLLLDEPFNALDAAACRTVEAAVTEHVARGGTAVIVTHDLARGAALAQRGAVLVGGRVVFEGEATEARARLDAALATATAAAAAKR